MHIYAGGNEGGYTLAARPHTAYSKHGYTLHVHTLLTANMDTPSTPTHCLRRRWIHPARTHTAYGEHGYTLHAHTLLTANMDTPCTPKHCVQRTWIHPAHLHIAYGKNGYTLHAHTPWWRKGKHPHVHTGDYRQGKNLTSILLTMERDTTSSTHCGGYGNVSKTLIMPEKS